MRPERVIHMLAQICYSLVEAHDAKLIHRDIKPANVFICRKGAEYDFVKVLDFGLVKPEFDGANLLTQGAEVLGTPAYISPEAAKGIPFDQRSDIYSLGCVAYFLLSGELVFPGDNPLEMIRKHVNEEPEPIGKRAPEPQNMDLNALVMKCLEKDPESRPQNCLEILEELERIATGCHWSRTSGLSWWHENISEETNRPGLAKQV
ncbi:MAG: serine/threonine protein kinase [Candidatus Krumholzibacteriia bacterium]|jgi:serine/threonine protein kinase